jgi:hypothetical protein
MFFTIDDISFNRAYNSNLLKMFPLKNILRDEALRDDKLSEDRFTRDSNDILFAKHILR